MWNQGIVNQLRESITRRRDIIVRRGHIMVTRVGEIHMDRTVPIMNRTDRTAHMAVIN